MTPFVATLEETLERQLRDYQVPGAVVAAVEGGRSYLKCYGLASLATGRAVTSRTAFNVASNTKAFLTTLLADLVARGELSWDDRVRDLLPGFRHEDACLQQALTLRDLCANRTGLGRVGLIEFGADPQISRAVLLEGFQYLPVNADLRSRFTYLNAGFMTAAAILERVLGKPVSDHLQDRLLKPLGMCHSAPGAAAAALKDRAVPHLAGPDGHKAVTPEFSDSYLGASALYVCGEDALPWLRLHARSLVAGDDSVIDPAALRATHEPQTLIGAADRAAWVGDPASSMAAYALGWAVSNFAGYELLCHAGLELGAASHTCVIPGAEIAVAVYTASLSPAPQVLSFTVLDHLLGQPVRDWHGILNDPRIPAPLPAEHAALIAPATPRAARPARPLEAYCGRYRSPQGDELVVSLHADTLYSTVRGSRLYSGDLLPLGADSFGLYGADAALLDMIGGPPRVDFSGGGDHAQALEMAWLGRFRSVS